MTSPDIEALERRLRAATAIELPTDDADFTPEKARRIIAGRNQLDTQAADAIASLLARVREVEAGRDDITRLYDAGVRAWNPVYEKVLNAKEAAESELTSLREENGRLRGALKVYCFGNATMEELLYGSEPDTAAMTITIPLGLHRAAREALARSSSENPHD